MMQGHIPGICPRCREGHNRTTRIARVFRAAGVARCRRIAALSNMREAGQLNPPRSSTARSCLPPSRARRSFRVETWISDPSKTYARPADSRTLASPVDIHSLRNLRKMGRSRGMPAASIASQFMMIRAPVVSRRKSMVSSRRGPSNVTSGNVRSSAYASTVRSWLFSHAALFCAGVEKPSQTGSVCAHCGISFTMNRWCRRSQSIEMPMPSRKATVTRRLKSRRRIGGL